MPGTPINLGFDTTTNRDLLKEGTLRKIFDTTQRDAVLESPALYNVLTTKNYIETDMQMAGLRLASEIADGESPGLQEPVLGNQKTYTQRFWGAAFRMTFWMDKFNKYGLWKRWTADLKKIQLEAKDIELAIPFNNMTSTTGGYGFTGSTTGVIAYDTHTGLYGGGTSDNYDNYLNSGLSVSAIDSARYYFDTLVDDLGLYMGATPTHLVYNSYLWLTVKELWGDEGKPYTADNTINAIATIPMQFYPYHRLTSISCWFVISKTDKYDFNLFTSMEPDFQISDAPDLSRDKVASSFQSFTYGFGDMRLLFCGDT